MHHKDYSKSKSRNYKWGYGNLYQINPALKKSLNKCKGKGKRLIEIGCGHGDYSTLARELNFSYTGIDNSPYMLEIAEKKYPKENFIQADARQLSKQLANKRFDIILSVMMLSSLSTKNEITTAFKNFKKLLDTKGTIIIVVSHPCFDPYVQLGFNYKKNVRANFTGYHVQGAPYTYTPKGSLQPFNDYHTTLQTYFEAAESAQLIVTTIDECKVTSKLENVDPELYKKKLFFPSYLLMELKHNKNKTSQ